MSNKCWPIPNYWGNGDEDDYSDEDDYGEEECTFDQDENGYCLQQSIQIPECADGYLSDGYSDCISHLLNHRQLLEKQLQHQVETKIFKLKLI